MREVAVSAGFYAFFGVLEISLAVRAQRIKRTIAEKTVEVFFGYIFMAGKVFTASILKEFVRKAAVIF